MGIRRRTLEHLAGRHERHHVVLGFDGFIDDLCHVMDVRADGHSMRRIATMAEFSRKVGSAAGLSCALELESQGIRPGGNAPNMGRTVLEFGNDLSLIATLGEREIHPIFREITGSCRAVISIGEPGYTEALEFLDGKLMLNRTGGLSAIGWDRLCAHVTPERLRAIAGSASLIGLLDWTIFPLMNEMVEGLLELIGERSERPVLFIDLSDLRRRPQQDIIHMADIIGRCGASTGTVLSLNESESLIAAQALSIAEDDPPARAGAIRDRLKISAVVIHPLEGAAVATLEGTCWIDGPYTPTPAVSTGGGDNFNAGFCNGWLLGMAPDECAVLGSYTSGYYVRHGRPPGKRELMEFIKTPIT